jgi:hypothetical protein
MLMDEYFEERRRGGRSQWVAPRQQVTAIQDVRVKEERLELQNQAGDKGGQE